MTESYGILAIELEDRQRYLKCELYVTNSMQIVRLCPHKLPKKLYSQEIVQIPQYLQSLRLTKKFEEKEIRSPYVNIVKMMKKDGEVNIKQFKKELIKLSKGIKEILEPIFKRFDIDVNSEKNLAIALDKETAKIPWELGYFNDSFVHLCDKINVGRLRIVEDYYWLATKEVKSSDRALVVGINYENSPLSLNGLDYAEDEAVKIKEILNDYDFKVTLLLGEEATKNNILKEIRKGAKIFHFTGHGDMKRKKSSIFAYDGELSTQEFASFYENIGKIPAPNLTFLNACQTSSEFSTKKRKDDGWESYNWAFTLAENGGRVFIGTLWPINDNKATQLFSCIFYREFLRESKPLASSLHEARRSVVRKDETAAYAYVLYAPPTLTKKDVME